MKTISSVGSLLRCCTAVFFLSACIAADVLAAVTIQPAPSVVPGAEVVLSTSASLPPPVTYQWRKGGNPITGATNATYAIASAKPEDSGSYDVVITSTNGSVTDAAAALVVLSPPAITTHPVHAMVQPGGTVTLSVVAAGSAPLAYQWHRNNTPIAGATAASLALANSQLAQAGRYHVAVSNAAGTALSAQAEVALTGQLWALGSDFYGAFRTRSANRAAH